ncbi:hypothetical protein KZZ52_02245 [Dactylosporangium sp. AC04546]|uniref:hypothetical protein n=1 Tax=Dactylosporangium sp. AC04546 TaxID=2862460 RepID=UPI001EDCAB23|nr:hypothetical protein [Dactylosporangium sp. AC04546]WVK84279.1 hypothetical protein KZZ52_02245 [Dactylosporangium sp. AC04546]
MSVSLILVPLAVAAVSAAHGLRAGRDEQNRVVCQVQTRMRDAQLLTAALHDAGAVVTGADPSAQELRAEWSGVQARFTRGTDGIWAAHFTGAVDEERAVDIVRAIDAAYGRQVQQAVLRRLRERAPAAGLRLESETVTRANEVRMVFAVEGGA